MTTSIKKLLSPNDVGNTGSHQAGILVPRSSGILSFFPALSTQQKNPRAELVMRSRTDGSRWEFNYIYYNNCYFGGTRNEYRLTGMTAYLRSITAQAGDSLIFEKDKNGSIWLSLDRAGGKLRFNDAGALIIGKSWIVIRS